MSVQGVRQAARALAAASLSNSPDRDQNANNQWGDEVVDRGFAAHVVTEKVVRSAGNRYRWRTRSGADGEQGSDARSELNFGAPAEDLLGS
jgi:hypothetical protein